MTDQLVLDADKGTFVACFGRKGSGKSEFCRYFFERYPYDGLLIDITRDGDPHHQLTEPWPVASTSWPEPTEERPWRKFRYVPDIRDDNHLEKVDDVLALAYEHGHVIEWWDEVGAIAGVGQTMPNARAALWWGRHAGPPGSARPISLLMAGPRVAGLDPLVLQQADLVVIFGRLHELDVKRVSQVLHLRDAELDRLLAGLDKYEFVAYDREEETLTHYPPLPIGDTRARA